MRCRPGEKHRVVARRVGAVAADGESRIDGKSFFRRRPRFIEPAEPRKGDGKVEMRGLEIPVDLDRVAQLRDGVFVLAKKDFATAQNSSTRDRAKVSRGLSLQRVVDMDFRLFAASEKALGHTDERVSVSEIAVDRERALEFGNALRDPIGVDLDDPQDMHVPERLFRRDRQRLDCERLGRSQASGSVVAHVRPGERAFRASGADNRIDVIRDRARERARTSLRASERRSGVSPLLYALIP